MNLLPLLAVLPAGLGFTAYRYRTAATRSRSVVARISDYTDPTR